MVYNKIMFPCHNICLGYVLSTLFLHSLTPLILDCRISIAGIFYFRKYHIDFSTESINFDLLVRSKIFGLNMPNNDEKLFKQMKWNELS